MTKGLFTETDIDVKKALWQKKQLKRESGDKGSNSDSASYLTFYNRFSCLEKEINVTDVLKTTFN